MKCPFLLEPHQIQGLDFINIYPVIQWLVKESVNLRNEKAERLKLFAIGQFHNHFKLQSSDKTKAERVEVLKAVKRIEDLYALKRQFKRKLNSEPDDEKSRVRLTLLEYGVRTAIKTPTKAGEKSSKPEAESFSSEMDQEEVGFEWRFAFECAFDIVAWFSPFSAFFIRF
jgi:N12 class adenine-specific DNA methylase